MKRVFLFFGIILVVFFILLSFYREAFPQKNSLILATTTSIQDSGLLDVLIPIFEKKTGFFVKTIAVGTGQALAMGRRGEADVLFVHSPEEEERFIAEGYGINRKRVMYNDFVVVGPKEDPARIKGLKKASSAFKRIAETKSLFISRGDNSGTHIKEISIWKKANISPEGQRWYHETGLGMGQTLSIASEKKAYTMTDRATYLAVRKRLNLHILAEGDPMLRNIYHVIEVNPERFKKINGAGARAFSDFLVSGEVQTIIKTFGMDSYGTPLFFIETQKRVGERGIRD